MLAVIVLSSGIASRAGFPLMLPPPFLRFFHILQPLARTYAYGVLSPYKTAQKQKKCRPEGLQPDHRTFHHFFLFYINLLSLLSLLSLTEMTVTTFCIGSDGSDRNDRKIYLYSKHGCFFITFGVLLVIKPYIIQKISQKTVTAMTGKPKLVTGKTIHLKFSCHPSFLAVSCHFRQFAVTVRRHRPVIFRCFYALPPCCPVSMKKRPIFALTGHCWPCWHKKRASLDG